MSAIDKLIRDGKLIETMSGHPINVDRTTNKAKPYALQVCNAGAMPESLDTHNYLRLLCASNNLKPYLEADLNSHQPWTKEIDEFLSAVDALQV